jgi:preprotein translocase subunit SecF
MRFLQHTNFNFMNLRRNMFIVSAVVIVAGLLSLVVKGVDYGIDFVGGTELVVQFQTPPDIGAIRSTMNGAGFDRSEIKTYGEANRIVIRTEQHGEGTVIADRIKAALDSSFPTYHPTILEEQKIGPKVGAELRRDAFYAILFSLVAMLVYIGFRFKFVYGFGAVIALFHDVLVTLGVISIVDGLTPYTNFEIDQNMVAAFLTLVGLSVNDTVVIFDRIRENQKIHRTLGMNELINKSLNQTLTRTIITSGTIFLVTIVLFLFGGEVNRGFAFALTIGIITGTYSSIYIASAFVLEYTNRKQAKALKPVRGEKPRYEALNQGS